MKYVILEKAEVRVKPYQRRGKMVIGYTRTDPRLAGKVEGAFEKPSKAAEEIYDPIEAAGLDDIAFFNPNKHDPMIKVYADEDFEHYSGWDLKDDQIENFVKEIEEGVEYGWDHKLTSQQKKDLKRVVEEFWTNWMEDYEREYPEGAISPRFDEHGDLRDVVTEWLHHIWKYGSKPYVTRQDSVERKKK